MRTSQILMPSRYYNGLIQLIIDHQNVPDEQWLDVRRGIELTGEQPATITLQQLDHLICDASALVNCSHLGLRLGSRTKLTSHGMLGFALLCSKTVEDMIRLACRYYHLIIPVFSMQYERGGKYGSITFSPSVAMHVDTLHFLIEAIALSSYAQLDSLVDGGVGSSESEVFLSTEAPDQVVDYLGTRYARFHFGTRRAPGVEIRVPNELLTCPLPMADARARQEAESCCARQTRMTTDAKSIAEFIEMLVFETRGVKITRETLAAAMNITVRTLNRYLQKEGTTFTEIYHPIRHRRACELLAQGNLTVGQVSSVLGFNDVSSFSRSFTLHAAMSPTQYLVSTD